MKKQSLTEGTAKNSIYFLANTFILKMGSLILTILLARLLLPDLFGIYTLALSVVVIALAITDFGTRITSIRYVAEALGKKDKSKARAYFRYLLKIRSLLVVSVIIILLIIAKPLANNIFNKPAVFLPLVAASLYIFLSSFKNFFTGLFYALKDLKKVPIISFINQLLTIIFSIVAILLLSPELKIAGIFIASAVGSFIALFTAFFLLRKNKELIIGKLPKIEKSKLLSYLGYVSIASVSLIVFGSVDTLMLGRFVETAYLGYYRVAISLVTTIAMSLSFSGIFLPLFTQLNGQRLNRGFQKIFRYLIILIIPAAFGLMFVARHIILAVYGKEYLLATTPLYILSFIIITGPLIGIYSALFKAKEKPKVLTQFILISLVINIILNYILIKSLLPISQEFAIVGAGLATVISRVFLLAALTIKTKSQFKLKASENPIIKSAIATLFMIAFLCFFNYYLDINLLLGAVEIILAALIYFLALRAIGGLEKEDFKLINSLFLKWKRKN